MSTRKGHIGIITRFELRRLRGNAGGVLFMMLFGITLIWLLVEMVELKDSVNAVSSVVAGGTGGFGSNAVLSIIAWFLDLEPSELSKIFKAYPVMLLLVFAVICSGTPYWILVLGSDQTGSDISRRHARYLTVRTDRRALYIGKTLAIFLFWAIALAIALLAVGAVTMGAGLLGSASALDGVLLLLRIYVSGLALALPFIAMSGAAAAMTGHPALGALVCFAFWAVVALVSWSMGLQNESMKHLEFAFPTAMKYELMSTNFGTVLAAASHQLAFAAVFFLGGLTIFSRRDV